MKTNGVTGRFRSGQVGIGIELGRPGTGARFRDVEKVTHPMAQLGSVWPNPACAVCSIHAGRQRC